MLAEPPNQTNRTVLDLSKVQWATFYYKNQYGQCSELKPIAPTVRGQALSETEYAFGVEPRTLLVDYAKQRSLLDKWTAVIKFQLTANHTAVFTGEKAVALRKAWNERIFNKRK